MYGICRLGKHAKFSYCKPAFRCVWVLLSANENGSIAIVHLSYVHTCLGAIRQLVFAIHGFATQLSNIRRGYVCYAFTHKTMLCDVTCQCDHKRLLYAKLSLFMRIEKFGVLKRTSKEINLYSFTLDHDLCRLAASGWSKMYGTSNLTFDPVTYTLQIIMWNNAFDWIFYL